MTSRERLFLFDTTLRDGQQTQGGAVLGRREGAYRPGAGCLGVDYIEGGWPGANPTDSESLPPPPRRGRG